MRSISYNTNPEMLQFFDRRSNSKRYHMLKGLNRFDPENQRFSAVPIASFKILLFDTPIGRFSDYPYENRPLFRFFPFATASARR